MPLTPSGFQDDRHDLQTVAPPGPAAGAGLHWPCPDNRVIHVVYVGTFLVAAGGGLNRWLFVNVENAGLVNALCSPSHTGQLPASMAYYHWTIGAPPTTVVGLLGAEHTMPLGSCYLLKTGDFLNIDVLNMAVDTLATIVIRYYEWNED